MSDESKDAARDERERFSQSTTQSRKKSTAEAVVGVAAPITPLKKGEEERTRAFSFFFSSLSLFLKYARFCFESHPEMWQV
jgi:hypothetical protein